MAKSVEEVVPSTPDEEEIEKKPKSKGKVNDGKATSEAEGDGQDGEDDNEEDDEEEEEFEISAILDAKRGYFQNAKYGYLVSWKGYEAEHNSWVNEDDAGNAEDLIKEFWAKRRQEDKRKKTSRKSEPITSGKRKSVDKDTSSPAESTSAKRGRGRPRKGESEEVKSADESDEDTRAKKKKTVEDGGASNSKAGRKSLSSLAKDTDQDGDIAMLNGDDAPPPPQPNFTNSKSLKAFANLKSWEDKVESVTTVERVGDDLMVYFLTTTGDCVRESSTLCAQKFPQKLIKFYESHLRWRIAGTDE